MHGQSQHAAVHHRITGWGNFSFWIPGRQPEESAQPEEPAGKDVSAQVKELGKKVNRALDTVQDKVSRFGKVIDRSVQNLAKVVLQNEDKDKPKDETDPTDELP